MGDRQSLYLNRETWTHPYLKRDSIPVAKLKAIGIGIIRLWVEIWTGDLPNTIQD